MSSGKTLVNRSLFIIVVLKQSEDLVGDPEA